MAIFQISLNDFRKLESDTLTFHPGVNYLYGNNGSGKTSLLESIHVITQGRSFKTTKLDQCINHNKESFLLFAHFDKHKVGIKRAHKQTLIHVDQAPVNRLSTLASITPIRAIHSETFSLITGSPSVKREYIDWCLFHVEHDYQKYWSSFTHALKQRNALLKKKDQSGQLEYWDRLFVKTAMPIYELRKSYIKRISSLLTADEKNLIPDLNINLHYEPGWNESSHLYDILKTTRDRDYRYGFSQFGPHRDNIKIMNNDVPAQEHLSRGQLKRLTIALLLQQIKMVKNLTGKKMIVLVDDLASELDNESIKSIIDSLFELGLQLFITSVQPNTQLFPAAQDYKMFHVEHGIITDVTNR